MKTAIKLTLILSLAIVLPFCKEDNTTEVQKKGWYIVNDTTMLDIKKCLKYPSSNWTSDTTFVVDSEYYTENDSTYKPKYVINDTNEYLQLQNHSYNPLCSIPMNIDFSQYTLLGRFLIFGGSEPAIMTRRVKRNDELKKIEYYISGEEQNWDDIPDGYRGMNWMLIPKIGEDYEVIFRQKIMRSTP